MDREATLEKNNSSRFAFPETALCFIFLPCTLYYLHVCIYFEAIDRTWCRAVGVSTLVGSGMCPGCIYAAVEDMKIIEGALLHQRTQQGFHGAAARQRGYCQWAKIAATTEAAVEASCGLDHSRVGFSSSHTLLNVCGLYSVLT